MLDLKEVVMEEIKIIMEALAKMGEGAQIAFVAWCVKEVLIYLVCPLTFGVIGFAVYKIASRLQNQYLTSKSTFNSKPTPKAGV